MVKYKMGCPSVNILMKAGIPVLSRTIVTMTMQHTIVDQCTLEKNPGKAKSMPRLYNEACHQRKGNNAQLQDVTTNLSETKTIIPVLGVRARSLSIFPLNADAFDFVDEASRTRRISFSALVATQISNRRRKRDLIWTYVQKGIISGFIYMFGEAISCGLFSRGGRIGLNLDSFVRTSVLHSTLIGMLANGPMLHLFFELVDRYIKHQSVFLTVVMKVIVDQLVWGVLWNFSYILLMNLATDSPGFGYVGEGLGMDFLLDLYKGWSSAFFKASNWRMHSKLLFEGLKMLPMDIICYWLVPLQLRALWVVSVDVFWVTILSQYD
jgi:hypothetical protein